MSFELLRPILIFFFFFFNDTATTEIYTLSLHDALPISHHDEGTAVAIAVAIEVRLRRGHDDHCRRGIIREGPGGPADHDHSRQERPRHAKPYSHSDPRLRRGGRRPGCREGEPQP